MKVIKPPTPFPVTWFYATVKGAPVIFLAGSIEEGTAVGWQAQVELALQDRDVFILNPRRDDWNSTWRSLPGDPNFLEQVTWELDGIECADQVVVYFDPATRSPITLLELGLFARSGKLLVCCPEGFWRKGNVDIVCKRYHVRQVPELSDLITVLTT